MKKDDLRYYVPLIMGFIIMMIALFAPPIGEIPQSAIFGGGSFLILCAVVAGLDIPATLHEINELKKLRTESK